MKIQRCHVRISMSPLYATYLVVICPVLKHWRDPDQNRNRGEGDVRIFGMLRILDSVFLKRGIASDVCWYFRGQRSAFFFINVCEPVGWNHFFAKQNIDLFTAPEHAYKFSTVRNFSNDSYTPVTFFTTHRPTVFPILAIHAISVWLCLRKWEPPKLSKKMCKRYKALYILQTRIINECVYLLNGSLRYRTPNWIFCVWNLRKPRIAGSHVFWFPVSFPTIFASGLPVAHMCNFWNLNQWG